MQAEAPIKTGLSVVKYDGEACDLCDLRSNEPFLPILLMIDRLVGRLVLVVPAEVDAWRIRHP